MRRSLLFSKDTSLTADECIRILDLPFRYISDDVHKDARSRLVLAATARLTGLCASPVVAGCDCSKKGEAILD